MRCLGYLFTLVLVALLAFGAGFWMRGGPPTVGELLALADRLRGAPPSAQLAAAPAQQLGSATGPVVSRSGQQVTVQVDEATLTQQANASLAGQPIGDTPFGPATVRSLAVQLRNGEVAVSGTAAVGPTVAPVNVTGSARAENGRLRIGVTSAKIGGIPLPGPVQQEVERQLQAQVDQAMAQQGLRVRSVSVADGRLVATGTTT